MRYSSRNDTTFGQTHMLWKRRKWLASSAFALVFSALAGLTFALPDLYRARATVMVNPDTAAIPPGRASPDASLDARLDSLTQEVESRPRLQDLITRFDLYPQLRKRVSPEAVITQMRRDIRFDREINEDTWGRGTTIAFTVSYQGWEPQTVAQVANALASSYVQGNEALSHSEAAGTAGSLEGQLRDVSGKLHAQEQQINAFKDAHLGELPEQQGANLATLEQLNTRLHQNSENQARAMENRVQLLKQIADTGTPGLAELQQELAKLRSRYTDSYPDVARIKAQIASLEHAPGQHAAPTAASADPLGAQLQQVDAELRSLKTEEAQTRADIASYQNRVENVPKREQELQALMQGYDETKELYSNLLKQYEQAQLGASFQGSELNPLQILDPAVAPHEPVGPNRLRLIFMALLISLGVTAAAVFLAEQLDTSFHTLDELRTFTRVPVLAVIPAVVTRPDVWRRRLRLGVTAVSILFAVAILARLSYALGQDNQQLVWLLTPHGSGTS